MKRYDVTVYMDSCGKKMLWGNCQMVLERIDPTEDELEGLTAIMLRLFGAGVRQGGVFKVSMNVHPSAEENGK